MSSIYRDGIEHAIAKLESPDRIKRHDPSVLFSKVGLSKGETVADLGCGTGFFAFPAAELVGPKGRIIAVDKIPDVLKVLKRKIGENGTNNIQVVEKDLLDTGIDDHSVDMILMANIFHDVDKRKCLSEDKRILRPNGRLVILDWKKIETDGGPPVEARFTLQEVVDILSRNGWKAGKRFDISADHYVVVATPAIG